MLGIAAQVAQQQQAETTGLAFLETTKNPVAHNTDALPVSSGKVEVTQKAVAAPSLNTGVVEMLDIDPNTSKTEILPTSQTSTAIAEVLPALSSTATKADTAAPSSVDAGVVQKLEIAPKSSASVEIAQVSEANVAKTELVKTVSTGDNSPSSAEITVGPAAKADETTSTVDVKPASEIQNSANKNSQASSALPLSQHGVSIADIVGQESQWQHQLAYDRLQKQYAMSDSEAMKRPFDDILVSYPIAPSLALTSVRDKFLVAPHALQRQRSNVPVIYAAGIATHPDFELAMVDVGLQVHAFDCTLPADPIAKLTEQQKQYVHFHPWCLGSKLPAQSSLQTEYARKSQNKTFEFNSIQESRVLLGHSHIDVLKLDIEGYEWEVLEREILQKKVFSVGNAASVSLETTSTSLKLDEVTSMTASTSGTAKVAAEFSDHTKVTSVDPTSTVSASTTTTAASTSTSEKEPTTLVANSASGAGSSGGLEMLDVAQIKAMTTSTVTTPAQRRFLRALSTTASESLQSNEQPQINFVMSNDKLIASGSMETPSVLSTSESKLVAKENTDSAFNSPQYLPSQLLFELHTKGANPNCVEPRLTQEKDRNAVNRLFAELWSLGYRVVFKYLNPEDPTCADFTLIRVPEAQLPPLQTPSNALSGASDAVVVSSTESVPSVTSEATVGGTSVASSFAVESVVTASLEPADVTKNQEATAVQFLNLDTAAANTRSATTAAVLPTSVPQDERVARKTSELQFQAPATSVAPVLAAASTAATTPQVQFLEPQAANAASTASNAAILSATQVPSQSQVQFLEPMTTSAASSIAVAAPATAQVQFLEMKSTGVAPSESTAAAAATPTSTLAASGTAAAVQFLEPKSTATPAAEPTTTAQVQFLEMKSNGAAPSESTAAVAVAPTSTVITAAEPTTTAQVQFLNADAGSASPAVPTTVATAPTVTSTTAASVVQFLEPATTSSALPSTTTTTTTAMSGPAQQQVQFLEAKTVVTTALARTSSSAIAATNVATPAQVQFLESASSGVDRQVTSTATVQAPSQQQVQFLEPQAVSTKATSLPAAAPAVTTVASSTSPAQVEILDLQPTKANTVVSSVATPSVTQESAQPQVQFLELQAKSDTTSAATTATATAATAPTTATKTTTTTASSTAAQAQSEQALQFLQAPAVSANIAAQVNAGASSTAAASAAAEAKSSTELQFLKQRRLRYQT